jgi:hypothetical protein
MKNNFILFFLVTINLMTSSCQKKKPMDEIFEYMPTASAPAEYPMIIYSGVMLYKGEALDYLDGLRDFNPGWGIENGDMSPHGRRSVPDAIDFTWLSIAEKKFYTGKFNLPQEKIAKILREGYQIKGWGERDNYHYLVVGLAPKGLIVVSLAGLKRIEIASFRAKETVVKPDLEVRNAEMFSKKYGRNGWDYCDFIMKEIEKETFRNPVLLDRLKKQGPPNPDVYSIYQKRWKWSTKIIIKDNELYNFSYETCNGEKDFINDANLNDFSSKAIPYNFEVFWVDKKKEDCSCRIVFSKDTTHWKWGDNERNGCSELPIDFEDAEIRKVFDQLDPNKPILFVLELDNDKKEIVIHLEQNEKKYLLKEFESTIG